MASAFKSCALLVLWLVTGLCSAADHNNILDVEFGLAMKHERWAAEHGRVYKDDVERSQRFEIFKHNLKYIEEFNNAGGHSYTLGLNQFADLTHEEFRDIYGGKFKIPQSELDQQEGVRSVKYEVMGRSLNDSIPDSIDWRQKGAVGPIIHQGGCGSCWAMAVVATIEGLHKIKTGKFTSLSAQQLIDCDYSNRGCKGGFLDKAYSYVKANGGITDAKTYRFWYGDRYSCNKVNEKKVVATIGGYQKVDRSEEKLAGAVAQVPVSAGIDSTTDEFRFYKSGIFNGPCSSKRDHAIAVVGYGGSGSAKYWIVRNSWGDSWGERGYIRMKRGVAPTGICGIAMDAWYPTN